MSAMNMWLTFAAVLLLGLIPCLIVCAKGRIMERFVAMQMAQIIAIQVLLLLAQGFNRDIYFDIALTQTVLALASGLVYARFLERWI